jgi:hypothetical protein
MPKCNPRNASAACGLSGSFETSGDGFNFSGSSMSCRRKECCTDCKCVEYGTIGVAEERDLFICRCGTYKIHELFFTKEDDYRVNTESELEAIELGTYPVSGDFVDLKYSLNIFVSDCVDGNILLDLNRVVDYVDATHKAHTGSLPGKKWPDPSEWPSILNLDLAHDYRVGVARLNVFNRGPYTVYLTCKDAESGAKFEGVSAQIGCRAGEGLSLLYTPVAKKWIVKTSYGS